MERTRLAARDRFAHALQREVGRLLALLWVPLCAGVLRFGLGWRIEGADEARRAYRRLRSESAGPLLVCANHLTMVDSFAVAWALGSSPWFVARFDSLPWNVPERENFAESLPKRVLAWIGKCIPVERGGSRAEVGRVLDRVAHLISRGEVALVFPEGGRSRTGRVEIEAQTYGIGRILKAVPGCRVLCVYLRGDHQESWSDVPVRGERFRVAIECIEPKTDLRGMRASLDLTRQILLQLSEMERRYFDDRK